MARYRVEIRPDARRQLIALPEPWRQRVDAKITALADNPRPTGARKLAGTANSWRIRVGNYRAIYTVQDQVLVVLVIKVAHRKEAYR